MYIPTSNDKKTLIKIINDSKKEINSFTIVNYKTADRHEYLIKVITYNEQKLNKIINS